jgi:hypothetical protein
LIQRRPRQRLATPFGNRGAASSAQRSWALTVIPHALSATRYWTGEPLQIERCDLAILLQVGANALSLRSLMDAAELLRPHSLLLVRWR